MLREASLIDINKIVELKLKMFEESGHMNLLSKDAYEIILNKYTSLYKDGIAQHFVIQDKSEIIACAGAFLKNDLPYSFYIQPVYGFVGDVYTYPKHRHKGYARLLMKEVISWLKIKRVDTIRLLATPQARHMYKELGFKATDEMVLSLED